MTLLFPNEAAWSRSVLIAPDGARSLISAGAPLRVAFAEFALTGRISASEVELGSGWLGGMRIRRR